MFLLDLCGALVYVDDIQYIEDLQADDGYQSRILFSLLNIMVYQITLVFENFGFYFYFYFERD